MNKYKLREELLFVYGILFILIFIGIGIKINYFLFELERIIVIIFLFFCGIHCFLQQNKILNGIIL